MAWFSFWFGSLALTLGLCSCSALCDREEECDVPMIDMSIPLQHFPEHQ